MRQRPQSASPCVQDCSQRDLLVQVGDLLDVPQTPVRKELFGLEGTSRDARCVVRIGNLMHIHLASCASKMKVPEERLRGALLTLKGCRFSGTQGRNEAGGLSVTVPVGAVCGMWKHAFGASMRFDAFQTVSPGTMQVRLNWTIPARPLLQRCGSAAASSKIWNQDARPTTAPHMGFGFSGGAKRPGLMLRGAQMREEKAADEEWMQRFMPNEDKSTGALDRQYESSKKDKLSVSDYHDRLLLQNKPKGHIVMRPYDSLAIPASENKAGPSLVSPSDS